ncbi:hypothetical protein ACS0TY_035057 [Phlomoides rotata]
MKHVCLSDASVISKPGDGIEKFIWLSASVAGELKLEICISILARFIIMPNRGLKLPRWEVEQGVMRYALVPERDEELLADEMWLFLWSKTVSCILWMSTITKNLIQSIRRLLILFFPLFLVHFL